MIIVDFLDLIKNKRFGPIKLGDTKSSVLELLGKPDGFSNPDFNPEFYDAILYDRFEFNFRDNKLNSISNLRISYWNKIWCLNPQFHYQNSSFRVTSWFKKPWHDTKLQSIKQKLDLEKITFVESKFLDSLTLTIDNNLELIFSSKSSFDKDIDEWTNINIEKLDLRLTNFFLVDK